MYGIKNTKQNRLESLKYQFESLEKKGYKKQVYKDLNIFVKNEDGKWYLSVFIGTSTKNVNKYYYRTEERMQEAIDGYKKSADYREQRKQAKIDEYNDRKAAKAERYKELAEKARDQSESAYQAAKKIGDFIPFGQPILVGHHSEGRHRRDLSKIDNNMRKSIELDEKAEYYENKAKNVENSNVISSEDPEAIDKLKNKLKRLQANQELMKKANKIIRNRLLPEVEKVEQLQKLGLSEKQAIEIMSPKHFGGAGFASFSLTNNNANINTVKKRIEYLEKMQSQESKEIKINGVKVVDNVEANRLQIFFDSIPPENKRTELKRNGFRWSPSNKCWQSYRNSYQITRAKKILKNT